MSYTREDYLKNRCTHRQYYAQYVNDWVKQTVLRIWSVDELKEAYKKDEHFNSIPLSKWDMLGGGMFNYLGFSQSETVCTLKEAALQIIENS